MEKAKIIEFLEKSGLQEVEQLAYEDGFVLRFFYDFDETELGAAKAYAKDECPEEEESETWYDEYFVPYLTDLAIDQVGEAMEEIMEDFEIGAQYVSFEMNEEDYSYNEFVAVFFEKGKDIEIEEVLEKLEL